MALPDDSVREFLLSHVIEHIHDILPLMQELWRVAEPGAMAEIRVPHGGNDDAWEDPTHVREMFPRSFAFFSQPHYCRADYGYRGDWQPEKIRLVVDRARFGAVDPQEIFERSRQERNVVTEMICWMRAVKPIREPRPELQVAPELEVAFAG
jgi:SAM-dependent methyltransferase